MPRDRVGDPVEGPATAVELPPLKHIRTSDLMPRDDEFVSMLCGFRRSGGLARGHEMASILARRCAGISELARLIAEGSVVHFDWRHDTWFPIFQFVGPSLAASPGVNRVLNEFRGVLDAWDTAHWFACPSAALVGLTPADAMESGPEWVLQAARCDRYLVDA